MDKLEQKILESASGGASPSSIGGQILEKGLGGIKRPEGPTTTEGTSVTPEEIRAKNDTTIVEVMQDVLKTEQQQRGGRGRQAGPELGSAIQSALQATQEEAKLMESLQNGGGFVRGGTEAEQAIEAIINNNEQEAAPATSTEIVATAPKEQASQSGYSNTMERIWKENEAKRAAMGVGESGAGLELEPIAPKPVQIENIPIPAGEAGPHLAVPAATEQGPVTIEGTFTKIAGTEIVPSLNTIDGPLTETASEKTPEQLKQEKLEKIRAKLEHMTGAVEARAEKVGMTDRIRKIGEMWNKVPKRYKYMVAAGMFLSGGGVAALGYTAASRVLGGAGAFVGFETMFKDSYEKKYPGERPADIKARHTLYAGVLAITIGALVPKLTSGLLDWMTPGAHEAIAAASHPLPQEVTGPQMSADQKGLDELAKAIQSGDTGTIKTTEETLGISHEDALKLIQERGITASGITSTPIESPVVASTPKIEYVVEKGGTLWGGIEHNLEAKGVFEGMQGGQKTYVLDALKDKFATMSPAELRAIGITSGNINVIHPGDHIDLTKVLGDTHLTADITHHAQALSPEQIYSIEHPVVAQPTAEALSGAASIHEAAPMSAEILPTDPAIITAAEEITHNYVHETFGTKGFLGIGAQDGMDSIDWKDPDVGFANQPVEKVLAAHPGAFPDDGARHFGVEDYTATQKMQAGLAQVQQETGVTPHPTETVVDYLKRSAITTLSEQAHNEPTTYRT